MSSDTPPEIPADPEGSAKAISSPLEAERGSELPVEAGASLADESTTEAAAGSATGTAVKSTGGATTESAAEAVLAPVESAAEAAAEASESDPDTHRFECRSCGFVYDPEEGVRKLGIGAGTPFVALDPASFRCPVCRSRVGAFKDIGPRNKPSGFEENLNFGLGVNRLTPGQKNVLIFGGFALAIAFFLSLYSLR
jgi:rubredoxin